ncbi:MAG: Hpt domain-containing protein [Desulfobacteraceae bacterium]|nr:Hpt domain-containing protein [Desulfobacteraceae bacterium]MCF8095157.1 Hpt domain-containing protein [Desulfobacteraceae bacterium]
MNTKDPASRLGLDPEQYRELVYLFVENTRREVSEIKEALRNNDLEKAANIVHSFRGAAVNLCLDEIAATGESLRDALRNLRDLEINPIIDKLLYQIEELSQSI